MPGRLSVHFSLASLAAVLFLLLPSSSNVEMYTRVSAFSLIMRLSVHLSSYLQGNTNTPSIVPLFFHQHNNRNPPVVFYCQTGSYFPLLFLLFFHLFSPFLLLAYFSLSLFTLYSSHCSSRVLFSTRQKIFTFCFCQKWALFFQEKKILTAVSLILHCNIYTRLIRGLFFDHLMASYN